jgi:hypothetical protein
VLTIAALVLLPTAVRGQADRHEPSRPTAVLVELFTSEGCSSCPPADAFLERIDVGQPLAGAELIVLSEHVDYWDHEGWKDPYSSSYLTDRQAAYVRALNLETAYTPQLIIDGRNEVKLRDAERIEQTFQKALASSKLSLHFDSSITDEGSSAQLRFRVEVDNVPERVKGDVFLVVALDRAESQVTNGENSGRHLTHVGVVKEFKKVGRVEKPGRFSQEGALKLKRGIDSQPLRIVAVIQEPGAGRVLGCAMHKLSR